MTWKKAATVALAGLLAVGVSACSDDKSGSDSSSTVVTQAAPSTTPAPSATATKGGGSVPVRLQIPSIGFDRKLDGMGLTKQGTISPAPGVTQWYDATVSPGQPGISVIAGHVTWNGNPDVFEKLEKMKVGDKFTISYADGTKKTFVANREKSVDKTQLQSDQTVWGTSKTPVVALITCDALSPVQGVHHTNNFVVWGVPA